MIVKITKQQYIYITHHLSKDNKELMGKLNMLLEGEIIYLGIEPEDADEIRDWAGEKQQLIGYDINYNLTSDGILLQQIVDIFFIE